MASEHEGLHTRVDDREGLLRLFRALRGRRLIGVGAGTEAVELVFELGEPPGGNLVTVYTDGPRRGQVAHGYIDLDIVGPGYTD